MLYKPFFLDISDRASMFRNLDAVSSLSEMDQTDTICYIWWGRHLLLVTNLTNTQKILRKKMLVFITYIIAGKNPNFQNYYFRLTCFFLFIESVYVLQWKNLKLCWSSKGHTVQSKLQGTSFISVNWKTKNHYCSIPDWDHTYFTSYGICQSFQGKKSMINLVIFKIPTVFFFVYRINC